MSVNIDKLEKDMKSLADDLKKIKQEKMGELKARVVDLAEEVKVICKNRGLQTIDKLNGGLNTAAPRQATRLWHGAALPTPEEAGFYAQ